MHRRIRLRSVGYYRQAGNRDDGLRERGRLPLAVDSFRGWWGDPYITLLYATDQRFRIELPDAGRNFE